MKTAKIFYDHLTITQEVTVELDRYHIDVSEKEELIQLVDETMHHRILDLILRNLPQDKHEMFLTNFHKAPHDPSLLEFLKKEISVDFEKQIADEANKIKKEILAEIKRAKRVK